MNFLKPKAEAMDALINDIRKVRSGIHFAKNSLGALRYTTEAQHHLDLALHSLQRVLDMVGYDTKLFEDQDTIDKAYQNEVASKLLKHVRGQILELCQVLIDIQYKIQAPPVSALRTLINDALMQLTHADFFLLGYLKPFMQKTNMEIVEHGK